MSIRVIVTGGAGFIGTLLARRLLAGPVAIGGAGAFDVAELFIVDLAAPAPDVAADPRVRGVPGDLATALARAGEADVIFHLAGVVSAPIALSSPRCTLEGIVRAAAVSDAAWGSRTAMNLPGLTTTPRDMAAAMDRVAGYPAAELIDWGDDPVIGAIVRTWPARVQAPRARALGLRAEESFDDIVRAYLTGNRPGDPGLR